MKKAFPVVITPSGEYYVAYIPDLQINTEGESIADTIAMAREAIGLWGLSQEDVGNKIPEPSDIPQQKGQEIVTLVDIDFSAYRRMQNNKAVHKNCTIPQWLNELAEKEQINFSAVLQDALKRVLGLNNC